MAIVVFLKGINVGGYRRFRPGEFARKLTGLDAVSVGAAGTFIVRGTTKHGPIRQSLKQRLPFEADVMICEGDEIADLVASNPFRGRRTQADVIQFAGILLEGRAPSGPVPVTLPSAGDWYVKVLEQRGRYVLGIHRRRMKAIGYLQQLETVLGGRITIRGWKTMQTVARMLKA